MKCCSRHKKRIKDVYRVGNITFTVISTCSFLILGILILAFAGSLYRYKWLLLPKRAFPLSSFIMIYLTSFSLMGASMGYIITDRMYRRKTDKVVTVLLIVAITLLTWMWYNIIFGSMSFLCGFIFSFVIFSLSLILLLFIFKFFKRITVLLIPTIIFNMYVVWLSFSIMILN